jgi:hypothetical protein
VEGNKINKEKRTRDKTRSKTGSKRQEDKTRRQEQGARK